MGAENGPSVEKIKNFNSKILTKAFALSERFRKNVVLSEKANKNDRDKANEEARNIINSSFDAGSVAETQIQPVIEFNSVDNMVAIFNDTGKTDFLRRRAESALREIGLALSLNSNVFEAAIKGVDELEKVLPSCLSGIHEYVLLHDLTGGKDDEDGIGLVRELVDVFKHKKKANDYPGLYKGDFEEKSKNLHTKLLDRIQGSTVEDEENGNVYRWSTLLLYVSQIDERTTKIAEFKESTESPSGRHRRSGRGSSEGTTRNYSNRYEISDSIEQETDIEILTNLARKNLDYIEGLEDLSNRYRLTGQPTDILDHISIRLKNLISEAEITSNENLEKYNLLRKEIKARLAIFDIGKLVEDAKFRITEPGRGGIGDVIDQAANIDRVLDYEVMEFCLREAKGVGYDIALAWNLIQKANFHYKEFLKTVWESDTRGIPRGETAEEYEIKKREFLDIDKKMSCVPGQDGGLFMDTSFNPWRAEIVDRYIISQLGENGKKTYQLANELVSATAERSGFNFGFINGDGLSEAIYFRDFRNDDASKGKKVGPVANRGIESLAHGWLRYLPKEPKDYLTEEMGELLAENIKIEEIKGKKTSIMYFTKILPSYVLSTKNALMDNDPDIKKILNLSSLQELTGNFDKVDIPYKIIKTQSGYRKANATDDIEKTEESRCGEQKIKVYYFLGLLELFATKENLGFSVEMTKNLRKIFVDTKLSDTKKSFISEEQWNWCMQQKIGYQEIGGRVRSLTFDQIMKIRTNIRIKDAFWGGFFDGIGSGKKKK